jgi:endoglucanase
VGQAADVAEVERRIDELVDNWHASFIRLDLESYTGTAVNSEPVTADASYLADIVDIINYIGTKSGVYVLMSLWVDPTFSAMGWPTTQTTSEWQLLANTFKNTPWVIYGIANEPQSNSDGSLDAEVWAAMNATVGAIREVESTNGTPNHIITVQGTRNWARYITYYVANPITAGGGVNIAYETHVYDPTSNFQSEFVTPAASIPVVIGEFGPVSGDMTSTDTENLMATAEPLQIPYAAWTFHMRCPPNLLVDNSNGGCGVGMALQPTAWGQQLQQRLADPPAQ